MAGEARRGSGIRDSSARDCLVTSEATDGGRRRMNHRSLTMIVHGESGAGKSWWAGPAPAPRLVFDIEGGVRFTPSRKVSWDPRMALPPDDGSWDTAVVTVPDMDMLGRGYQWLTSGQKHPFKSVVIDSLTEAQQRFKDKLGAPGELLRIQDWGELGDR